MIYKFELEYGKTKAYGANLIAENMWSTINNESYHEDTLESVVDVRFEKNSVKNSFYYDRNGNRKVMKTTRNYELLVAIKDVMRRRSWIRHGYL